MTIYLDLHVVYTSLSAIELGSTFCQGRRESRRDFERRVDRFVAWLSQRQEKAMAARDAAVTVTAVDVEVQSFQMCD